MKAADYIRDHGKYAEVYTLATPEGANLHLAITALRAAILAAPLKSELCEITDRDVEFMIRSRALLPQRVEQIVIEFKSRKPDPVIFCVDETGRRLLVDGHHRYYAWYVCGAKRIAGYLCYPALWSQFIITDLPDVTPEELRRERPNPWGSIPR